ncbi:MAG: KpsF/GutQ family sugar-phosphate isomerase [Candidatus Omnitrophica bacterium]|nr:KpsF/GutQ family sugar-phosphate isomerase [Candidatus Omnitrophota bacterium]
MSLRKELERKEDIKTIVALGRKTLTVEAEAISQAVKKVGDNFYEACRTIFEATGRVVVTGMGKPGFIAQKISATLSSTGTPSLYLHPAEAIHGDLGRVTKEDIVLALSNSGETEEIVRLIPLIKRIGAKLIAITNNANSTLATSSDILLDMEVTSEACYLGLAPTSSTTAMLALGDALAIALAFMHDFRPEDFAFYHPGGALGKRLLLRVRDIMRSGSDNPIVSEDAQVKEALIAVTTARAGSVTVVDGKGRLAGIFTDGDLRRHFEKEGDISNIPISRVMTPHPITISGDTLAQEALTILREKKIDEIPVVDENGAPVGLIDVQDLLKAGLV